MIGKLMCMAGWHSAKWLPPTPDRLEVVCRRCNLLLERVYLPLRSQVSAVPSPADPPPSVPRAPRAPAGGDTPGTFSGGGQE